MNFLNFLDLQSITCGETEIPGKIAYIVHTIIILIQFGVPLLLIIFGMLDLGKAVIASKEDEIKKGQQMFIKRLITAVIVFFVITVVQVVVNLATSDSDTEESNIWDCVDVFIKGVDKNCKVKN